DGAMFMPIILGSDKTTVSVATCQNEYYPLYLSTGNIHNNVRRAHRGSVVPIAFLAIPKSNREDEKDPAFHQFRRQLFHTSLSYILEPLKCNMSRPLIACCPDGHFRRIIFGLGPYIADYPEQALLASIVNGWCARCRAKYDDLEGIGEARTKVHCDRVSQAFDDDPDILWHTYGIVLDVPPFTDDFPRADISELLAPDLLQQVIKGVFKDHLVEWIWNFLKLEHGEAQAERIMDDIDQRIAAAPPFLHLRRFPDGRKFQQWTGDDSKALMKVLLPALVGHLPPAIIRCIRSFLDLCYLLRRYSHDQDSLKQIDTTLAEFHHHREHFHRTGTRLDFSLPRQHSLVHYHHLIEEFGSPNGLCSSITESRHITAVKEPWHQSGKYQALRQMLETNQRLDKLTAARSHLSEQGFLQGTVLSDAIDNLIGSRDDGVHLEDGSDSVSDHNAAEETGDDEDDDGEPVDDYAAAGAEVQMSLQTPHTSVGDSSTK
ncbi:hypothetical protein BOTBODRAFT_122748, partial [Botryobasidium botryosum FD-172 SS1]